MVGVLKRLNYTGGVPDTITNEELLLCMGYWTFKQYQRGALLPLTLLKRAWKEEKLRLPYQMTQSVPVWASCMTFELLGLIPWSLHRPLVCMDGNSMYQALGTNMIWASTAAPICRVWQSYRCALRASSGRLAEWLTVSGCWGYSASWWACLPSGSGGRSSAAQASW